MTKKTRIIVGIMTLIFLTLIVITTVIRQTRNDAYASKVVHGEVTFPDQTRIAVEIVDTDEKRRIGLSNHIFLDQDRGMLFLFDSPARYSFWMKDMDFPIDIIWMLDGKIVDMMENVLVSTNSSYPSYTPKTAVNQVLEVNAGFIANHPILIGESLILYK